MLFSEKMNSAINDQVGHEFGASLQYVAIAGYFDHEGLPELAAHFYQQAEEERAHAMRFVHYVLDAGGQLNIPTIPAPKPKFGSAEEAVQQSLDWETTVTGQINALVDLALTENDHTTKNFLNWFVTEQLEEISSVNTLLSIVRRAGNDGLLFVESYIARGRGPGSVPAAPAT
ncbi:MAG: ferritin [Anaerolineales bacterium]